jgi:hypothetical protein
MDWLESGVFCAIRADGCARNNVCSKRGTVFSVRSVPRPYKQVEWSGVKRVGWLAVRGLLRFSPCEPVLLEAGSCGTRIVREPRLRGTSAIESRYQATAGENTAG